MDAKKFCKDYNCGDKPINKCYKKEALKWHPDKQTGKTHEQKTEAGTKFRELGDAYGKIEENNKNRKCNEIEIPVATPVGEANTPGTAMSAPGTTMSVVVQDQVGSLGSWAFQFAKGGVKWAFSSPTNFMATVGSITILILMTHTATPAGNPEISFANFPDLRGGKKQTGGIDLKKGAAIVFGVFITVLTTLTTTNLGDLPIKMDNDNVPDGFQSEMVIARCAKAVEGRNFDGIYLKPAIGTNPNIERLNEELSKYDKKMEKVDKELQEMKEKNYDVPGYTYIDDYRPIYDSKVEEREGIVKKQKNINGTMENLILSESLYSQIYTNQTSDFNILECKFHAPVTDMVFLKQWMGYASGTAGENLGPVMKANKEFNRIQSDYQIPTPGTEDRIYDIFDINQDTGKVNINKINVTAFDKYIENEIQKMPSYMQKDKNGVEDGYGIMRDLRKYLKYSDIATDVDINGKESIVKIRNDAFAAKYRFIEKGALTLAIANNLPPEEGLLYVENLVYSHLMNDMLKMSDVIVTGLDATKRSEKNNVKNAIYNLMELTKYSIRMKNDKISSLNNNKVLAAYQAQVSAFAAAQKNASWENYIGENIKGAVMFVPNILKPSVQEVGGFAVDQILDLCGYVLDRIYRAIIDNPGHTATLALSVLFIVNALATLGASVWGNYSPEKGLSPQVVAGKLVDSVMSIPSGIFNLITWLRENKQEGIGEDTRKTIMVMDTVARVAGDPKMSPEKKAEIIAAALKQVVKETRSNQKESKGMEAIENADIMPQEVNMQELAVQKKRGELQTGILNRTIPREWLEDPPKPPRNQTITQTNEDVKRIEDAAEKAAERITNTAQPTSKTTDPTLLQIEDGKTSGGKRKSKKRGKRKTHRNTHGAPRKTKYARKKNTRKKGHGKKRGRK